MTRGQRSGWAAAAALAALAGAWVAGAGGRAAAQSDLEGPVAEEPVLSKPYRSTVPQFRRPWKEPPREAPPPAPPATTSAAPPPAPPAEAPAARPARVIPLPSRETAAAAPPPPRADEDEGEETPKPDATYVGVWGPTAAACSMRQARRLGYLPAVIRDDGARAGKTSCVFRDMKRAGNSWTMAASCRNARQRWTSHVRLSVDGNRLTWSSERGASVYVRCSRA
ncbi:hypothetical protein M446_1850 [Methylobacterium sp. 4-46]|uniref:hypothetical protein n=1 Tax=Methylobacterium sp. (strain 4-46) TaxID=426117 RepID=UPI000165C9AF|nr:hypothetical protein [Methylobacterium sp. 4-46]ACA16333.1 hypothetical protein M446_1850 [Methylobacterium sp. 4-46]